MAALLGVRPGQPPRETLSGNALASVDLALGGPQASHRAVKVVKVDAGTVDVADLESGVSLPGDAGHEGMLFAAARGGLRLEPSGGPVVVQRRRFVRVRAEVAAAVIAADEQRLLTQTIDLSVGGMLLLQRRRPGHERPRPLRA